ncbi:MAG TPA: hypothetical protein VJ970_00945 [Flavobacteriaceae bacterium]|nr:hypothetical protein [Flavobacteriaceae bacterium]
MKASQFKLNRSFFKTFKKEPQKIVDVYDLVYTTPKILAIERKRNNQSFEYFIKNRKVKKKSVIKRIQTLAIPPAWENVKIAQKQNAHIQAVGRDTKLRKQYRYHPKWNKLRNKTKFYKMVAFSKALPLMRERMENDLKQASWTQTKVLALVIKLLEESHIRIGNQYYAKQNKTYGLSTLRSKHINIYNNKFTLEFVGKRGKEHKVTIKNKKLTKLINKCEEIPGWELFQYFDENGEKQNINSTMINEYIQETCGEIFSAKDFRTWAASLIVFDTLNQNQENNTQTKEKLVINAIDTAANALNNTRTVCKKYYVNPHITESFLNDSIKPFFKMANELPKASATQLQPNEVALQTLLKTTSTTLAN